jgi:hypothetical protein
MPDVSRTEIGRRLFSIRKEKSVEMAIEKIRKQLGPQWATLSQDDIAALKRVLGEAWVFIERDAWEKIAFSRLSRGDLTDLIALGHASAEKDADHRDAVEKTSGILLHASERPA